MKKAMQVLRRIVLQPIFFFFAKQVTKELGGENYVFWGGREGYQSVLNTDISRELGHLASFLRFRLTVKTTEVV